jgi:hypothetical protein
MSEHTARAGEPSDELERVKKSNFVEYTVYTRRYCFQFK